MSKDRKSPYDNVNMTNIRNDERLRIQMVVIREMIERNHISLEKIDDTHKLTDVMTVKGSSKTLLTDVSKSER